MKGYAVLSIVLVFLLGATASAESLSWDVHTTQDQTFHRVTVDRYESDSLFMRFEGRTAAIHQDSIRLIVRMQEPRRGLGLLIGGAAGAAVGSTARSSGDTMRPVMAIVGAICGGLFGLVAESSGDTKYRLERMPPDDRRRLLSHLFPRGGPRPRF